MADIFVSYARADKERVAPLVAALAAQGWSVWWDPAISPGQEFDRAITEELDAAKAVIVVWTPASVDSRWVRGEAREAASRGVLVPVRFDKARLPLDASSLHTTDLDDWRGDASGAPIQELLRALRTLIARSASAASVAPIPQGAAAPAAPQAPLASSFRLKRWQIGAAGAALIAIAGALVLFAHKDAKQPSPVGASAIQSRAPAARQDSFASSRANPELPQTQALAKPRLAVMPFRNLSSDPNNAFFTDGMHEEILSAIANSAPGLEVISSTTMASFAGKPVTAAELAKELGCTHVLEGAVQREGDEVRLTLQLIDARDDSHVWAQDYDRTLKNALTLETEVAGEVAKQLSVKLLPAQGTAPTKNPQAYDLYLKARLARQGLSGDALESAWRNVESLLTQAIDLDPSFVQAYVERIYAEGFIAAVGYDTTGESLARMQSDIRIVEGLAPGDPLLLAAQGFADLQSGGDLKNALALFEQANAAGLSDPDWMWWEASAYLEMGDSERSLSILRRAVALDPRNPTLLSYLWFGLVNAHQPAEAIQVMDRFDQLLHLPSGQTSLRDVTVTIFTGRTTPTVQRQQNTRTLSELADYARQSGGDYEAVMENWAFVNRLGHNYAPARALLAQMPGRTFRSALAAFFPVSVGRSPVAHLAGWFDLLLGNKAAMGADARDILDFVRTEKVGALDAYYPKMLEAEGRLLLGDKVAALAAARQAMALAPPERGRTRATVARYMGAQVLAWSGGEEEAARYLEALAVEAPGLAPLFIAGDPVFTVPLANNARYLALKAKLQAQMAATKLE